MPAVVIGGSAGALDPLRTIVSELPPEFSAAVFVVIHVPASSVSALPHILARAGALFATHAIDRAPVAPGRIIVAPPDRHLILEDHIMRSVVGPTENNHRPSIDVLFRSAAATFGAATCGVLLSGTLDDGVAGLDAIRRAGGATFAQDPEEAEFADMPANAIAAGVVEGIYPAARLAFAIAEWLKRPVVPKIAGRLPPDERRAGAPSVFTCPDCGGTLWELDEGGVLRFRCRTGHAYTAHSMLAAQENRLETALWTATRALEERRDMLARLARRARAVDDSTMLSRYERQSREVEADLERLHAALGGLLTSANPA